MITSETEKAVNCHHMTTVKEVFWLSLQHYIYKPVKR